MLFVFGKRYGQPGVRHVARRLPFYRLAAVSVSREPAAVRAGIGKVGRHTFRHSYRAWLKRFAAPAEIQKELMRHSNLRTPLEIYGIEPEVGPAHHEANSVVKVLLGKTGK